MTEPLSDNTADVIVVGAGPAGSTTAYPCVMKYTIERGPKSRNWFLLYVRSVRSYPDCSVYSRG